MRRYAHGPFGETLRSTGLRAARCNWKFSTKYADNESGWVYFPYRYYGPERGVWYSRDPIAENGGVNLYVILRNCLLDAQDSIGLRSAEQRGRSCKVLIWIGHNTSKGGIRGELKARYLEYANDPCVRHALIGCRVQNIIDDEVIPAARFVDQHPAITFDMGGFFLRRDYWPPQFSKWIYTNDDTDNIYNSGAKGEAGDFFRYYARGMTYSEFNLRIVSAVIEAAKAEGLRMANDATFMKGCCCTRVDVQVMPVSGYAVWPIVGSSVFGNSFLRMPEVRTIIDDIIHNPLSYSVRN